MELFSHLALGFGVAFTPINLLYAFIGCVLGPMMEENLRRALLLSRGDWSVFVTRGLAAAALLLVIVLLPAVKSKRELAFVEE